MPLVSKITVRAVLLCIVQPLLAQQPDPEFCAQQNDCVSCLLAGCNSIMSVTNPTNCNAFMIADGPPVYSASRPEEASQQCEKKAALEARVRMCDAIQDCSSCLSSPSECKWGSYSQPILSIFGGVEKNKESYKCVAQSFGMMPFYTEENCKDFPPVQRSCSAYEDCESCLLAGCNTYMSTTSFQCTDGVIADGPTMYFGKKGDETAAQNNCQAKRELEARTRACKGLTTCGACTSSEYECKWAAPDFSFGDTQSTQPLDWNCYAQTMGMIPMRIDTDCSQQVPSPQASEAECQAQADCVSCLMKGCNTYMTSEFKCTSDEIMDIGMWSGQGYIGDKAHAEALCKDKDMAETRKRECPKNSGCEECLNSPYRCNYVASNRDGSGNWKCMGKVYGDMLMPVANKCNGHAVVTYDDTYIWGGGDDDDDENRTESINVEGSDDDDNTTTNIDDDDDDDDDYINIESINSAATMSVPLSSVCIFAAALFSSLFSIYL